MKVIIIGPYPPPYGGISIHIKRMKAYLEKNNVEVVLYDENKISSWKRFVFKIPFLKGDMIHFHITNGKIRILLGFYKMFFKKIILTIHGESLNNQIKKYNFIFRALLIQSLKRVDKIICVNSMIKKKLISLGVDENKVEHIPAYIKPIENSQDSEKIPEFVWRFVEESYFLISANGRIRFYKNEDLYGIDMLIDLMYRIKKDNMNVKLILALLGVNEQNNDEKKYYRMLKQKITELNLQKDILIYEVNDTEFYPILKKSDLFIRPTNTDGDAVSIREAFYYKVPVIASDVVERPEGSVLFKSRDFKDLYDKTVSIIQNYESHKSNIENIIVEDNAERLINLYKSEY